MYDDELFYYYLLLLFHRLRACTSVHSIRRLIRVLTIPKNQKQIQIEKPKIAHIHHKLNISIGWLCSSAMQRHYAIHDVHQPTESNAKSFNETAKQNTIWHNLLHIH